ncbi:MAG: sulfotransferase [Pseudomonadota bacterium]
MTDQKPLPRVVAVGFNKCATRSLTELFRSAGHPVVHHKVRRAWQRSRSIGRIIRDNLAAGRKAFHGAEEYTFYSDLIYSTPTESFEGAAKFREILRDYPDTILILNFRDREHWIASRLRHGHGEFAKREMAARGLDTTDALTDQWRADWDAHVEQVRAFMADRPDQFIDFDIDTESAEKIVKRLPDYKLNAEDFADVGRTRGKKMSPVLKALKTFVAHKKPRSLR